jgi:hypothetical protein
MVSVTGKGDCYRSSYANTCSVIYVNKSMHCVTHNDDNDVDADHRKCCDGEGYNNDLTDCDAYKDESYDREGTNVKQFDNFEVCCDRDAYSDCSVSVVNNYNYFDSDPSDYCGDSDFIDYCGDRVVEREVCGDRVVENEVLGDSAVENEVLGDRVVENEACSGRKADYDCFESSIYKEVYWDGDAYRKGSCDSVDNKELYGDSHEDNEDCRDGSVYKNMYCSSKAYDKECAENVMDNNECGESNIHINGCCYTSSNGYKEVYCYTCSYFCTSESLLDKEECCDSDAYKNEGGEGAVDRKDCYRGNTHYGDCCNGVINREAGGDCDAYDDECCDSHVKWCVREVIENCFESNACRDMCRDSRTVGEERYKSKRCKYEGCDSGICTEKNNCNVIDSVVDINNCGESCIDIDVVKEDWSNTDSKENNDKCGDIYPGIVSEDKTVARNENDHCDKDSNTNIGRDEDRISSHDVDNSECCDMDCADWKYIDSNKDNDDDYDDYHSADKGEYDKVNSSVFYRRGSDEDNGCFEGCNNTDIDVWWDCDLKNFLCYTYEDNDCFKREIIIIVIRMMVIVTVMVTPIVVTEMVMPIEVAIRYINVSNLCAKSVGFTLSYYFGSYMSLVSNSYFENGRT